jgi:hypothetical protein
LDAIPLVAQERRRAGDKGREASEEEGRNAGIDHVLRKMSGPFALFIDGSAIGAKP